MNRCNYCKLRELTARADVGWGRQIVTVRPSPGGGFDVFIHRTDERPVPWGVPNVHSN